MSDNYDYIKIGDQILEYLNKARRDPKWVADELSKLKKFYKEKQYRNTNYSFNVLTEEGYKAVEEAIFYLKTEARPVPELELDIKLSKSSSELVSYIGPKGLLNNDCQEMSIENRTKNQIEDVGQVSENVSFGWADPKEIVLQLIIDDGVKSRGHRKNIFDEKFTKVGLSVGPHKVYMHCSVIIFHGNSVHDGEVEFDKYMISDEEWPENAISLKKHINTYTQDNQKVIVIVFVFTLSDGETVTKTKEIIEENN